MASLFLFISLFLGLFAGLSGQSLYSKDIFCRELNDYQVEIVDREGQIANPAIRLSLVPGPAVAGVFPIVVEVTDYDGAAYSARISLTIQDAVAVDPGLYAGLLSIYPNPARGTLNVEYKGHTVPDAIFELFNNGGERVRRSQLQAGRQVFSIRELPSGIYYGRLVVGRNVYTVPLVLINE